MDCKDAKKRIHEYIDGDTEYAQISAHIAVCAECRAYCESLMQQKELLASLASQNAPSFDLTAAKRRKKAKFPRAAAWASAAAAVLVVVLITGSMGLFSGAKSEAPAAERAEFETYAITEGAAEEAAPAAEEAAAPAEEAPAPPEDLFIPDEQHAEEAAPPEKEEAPAEEAPEAEAEEAVTEASAGIDIPLSPDNYDRLLAELHAEGYHPEQTEQEFCIDITEENAEKLSKFFAPYLSQELKAGNIIYCSRIFATPTPEPLK